MDVIDSFVRNDRVKNNKELIEEFYPDNSEDSEEGNSINI
jgi:hypothetical protein